MKIDHVIHNDVIMSKPLEEQTFGVAEEDVGVIIEILRDKLYSNKRKIVVQEYMCNARDAHREVGNEDTPITVKLPNVGCPTFEVRDFGPGITPERMATVFVRYGASTKRCDNDQTGGYGIGAKSAWSYCDQFGIVTYVDGTERHYSAFLDDGESERGRVGKVALLHECETKEPNGTKIVVPIKVEDFKSFINYAKETAEFWDVRPNFTGVAEGEVVFEKYEYLEEGDNWNLIKSSLGQNTSFVIVDGIKYPVQMNELEGLCDVSRTILSRDKVHIFFATGEVSISANREALYYNQKTKDAIANRLKEMAESLSEKIGKTVKKCKTWLEAKNTWCEICRASTVAFSMGTFEWRKGKFIDNCDIYTYGWGEWKNIHIQRWIFTNNEVIIGSKKERISFPLKNDIIVVNDAEKFPSKPRLMTLFKGRDPNNPEFNGIITISSVKRGIYDAELEDKDLKKKLKDWTKKNNLNGKEIKRLSAVEKTKTVRVGAGATGNYNDGCITVKKITLDNYGYPQQEKVRINPAQDSGVWASVYEGALDINKDLSVSLDNGYKILSTIFKEAGVTEIYAIPQRVVYKVTSSDMKTLHSVFVEAVKKKVNSVSMKFKNADINNDMEKMAKVGREIKASKKVTDDHPIMVFANNIKTYEDERKRHAAIDRLVKMTSGEVDMKLFKDATAYDFVAEYNDLVKTYPMLRLYLKRVGYYAYFIDEPDDRNTITDYIAMMDLVNAPIT